MPVGNILSVQNLTVDYDGGNTSSSDAVDDISFDVQEGDLLGIVGPNGAGKTTLFRAILGLQPYSRGEIILFGHGPDKLRSMIPLVGYVPQKITFEPNFPATVRDLVSMGIMSEKRLAEGARLIEEGTGCKWRRIYKGAGSTRERIDAVLEAAGIGHLEGRRIGELSGGEQQRVFIAKSLVNDPILMILDEPVTGVDTESQKRFYEIIKALNEENAITIIWSSHDLDAISDYANRVACMNRKLFFHGKKEQFFADEEILKTYTESSMQMHIHGHHNC